MNKTLLQSLLTGLIALAGPAMAQEYRSPEWNGCIRQYYDRSMYGWLAFENTCGERLKVVYVPYNPGHGGSLKTLAPGRHDSTGYSRQEVDAKGGFELYICPDGYVPVDANNRYINRVNTPFRCKRD